MFSLIEVTKRERIYEKLEIQNMVLENRCTCKYQMHCTKEKKKFYIKDFFSWPHLLKKSLNFIFCAVMHSYIIPSQHLIVQS